MQNFGGENFQHVGLAIRQTFPPSKFYAIPYFFKVLHMAIWSVFKIRALRYITRYLAQYIIK